MSTNLTGTFEVQIMEVKHSAERNCLDWKLEILEGPHKGETLKRYNSSKTDAARRFMIQDFIKCGLHVKDYDEALRRARELLGRCLTVEAVTNNEGFPVVYIKSAIEARAIELAPTVDRERAQDLISSIKEQLVRLEGLLA